MKSGETKGRHEGKTCKCWGGGDLLGGGADCRDAAVLPSVPSINTSRLIR